MLYGDNTEFFTPFRVGETILGGQLSTWVEGAAGDHAELRAGVFADRRWGSDHFTDSLKPLLSFRYQTTHSQGFLGSLETVRRHGLLEPLMVTTRELTAPVEYGLQWLETRRAFKGDVWVNWQKLNTPNQREQFELGGVFRFDPSRILAVDGQHLWLHRGGQLFDAGVPVSNNHVTALGVTLHDTIRVMGAVTASLSGWRIWSTGHIDPFYPADRPGKGAGTYLRASFAKRGLVEAFLIHWRGKDFSGDAGDNNYNSTGHDPSFYRAKRKYTEIGLLKRAQLGGGASIDLEARWHRIDNEKSIAFFNTRWEFSYRLVARAPIDVLVRR